MSFKAVEYIDELVAVGVPEPQAKAQVRILQDFKDSDLATKQDLALVKRDIIITLGGMIVAGVVILAALMKI